MVGVNPLQKGQSLDGDGRRMVPRWKQILAQQQGWAQQNGIQFDSRGYTFSLYDNMYIPPSPATVDEFKSGKGDELGIGDKRGKMQALHSSSALVLNVFEYWRNRDIDSIARICGAPGGTSRMGFEQTHPTGLGGVPPHLDVEFLGPGLTLAIESKFTEPYHYHTKRGIKEKYLGMESLWRALPHCRRIAEHIREEQGGRTSFAYLDAPQLLKHILGLTMAYGPTGFELLYLWYEVPSKEAQRHRCEIADFNDHLGGEVRFRAMTYQELYGSLKKCANSDQDYLLYLGDRYFSRSDALVAPPGYVA